MSLHGYVCVYDFFSMYVWPWEFNFGLCFSIKKAVEFVVMYKKTQIMELKMYSDIGVEGD
jgi:hypothetical protein